MAGERWRAWGGCEVVVGPWFERARELCRAWVDHHPRCVTVEPLDFVYTGGVESGVRVKLINYPRFPASCDELWDTARKLALHLLDGLDQQSLSIVATDRTEWISRRVEDVGALGKSRIEPRPLR